MNAYLMSDKPAWHRAIGSIRSGILAHRSVQALIAAWILGNLLVTMIAQGSLPLDRPIMGGASFREQLVTANVAMLEALLLIGVVTWMTRHRDGARIVAMATAGTDVRRETGIIAAYGALALLGGIALGQALRMDPVSFHLSGTLFGSHDHDLVTPRVALVWAGYNLVAYVIVPLLWLGRRVSRDGLLLHSHDRRHDALLVGVVLVIESLVQVTTLSDAIFGLGFRQVVLGAPLTFGLYALGTVLPTMIFVQALLVPRFLALTNSAPAAAILGGVAYAAMHFPETWMVMTSPGNTLISLIFLGFTYVGPGMAKATLTLRTGNAWVHAWAYHAIAPHTLLDTPLIVRIFGIR
jgi:hypothetical protein